MNILLFIIAASLVGCNTTSSSEDYLLFEKNNEERLNKATSMYIWKKIDSPKPGYDCYLYYNKGSKSDRAWINHHYQFFSSPVCFELE